MLLSIELEIHSESFEQLFADSVVLDQKLVFAFLSVSDDAEPESSVRVTGVPDLHPTECVQFHVVLEPAYTCGTESKRKFPQSRLGL